MLKSYKTLKKYQVWLTNLNSTVNKINNTKLSMIDIKPKDGY